jgi:uncharacterized protein YdeI (YjbR/CyaY-like superfamily)
LRYNDFVNISDGTAHKMPFDLQQALTKNKDIVSAWESLTPLARNEWICWNISVKQQKTRDEHIRRTLEDLAKGKRRPCCWSGCIHRTDKPLNASQKWLAKR